MGQRSAISIGAISIGAIAVWGDGAGGADRDGPRETVTQTMTRTGVGGGDLSGAVDDSHE